MDSIQTLLIVVVISLSVLLIVVGVQVFLVLLDARRTLKKVQQVIDENSGGSVMDVVRSLIKAYKRDN